MKVGIIGEFTGTVRDAFIARGHDAISCDLTESEKPGPHRQGDARDWDWSDCDLVVAHPPCPRLARVALPYIVSRGCWDEVDRAAEFFVWCYAQGDRNCTENPLPHRHAVERIGRRFSQIVQPWQFGHPYRKATCLWLRRLPPLMHGKHHCIRDKWVRDNESKRDRARNRARTFSGIAQAMADQWGRPS